MLAVTLSFQFWRQRECPTDQPVNTGTVVVKGGRGPFCFWETFSNYKNIFDHPNFGVRVTGILWVEAKDAAKKNPAIPTQPSHNKELSGLNGYYCQGWEILQKNLYLNTVSLTSELHLPTKGCQRDRSSQYIFYVQGKSGKGENLICSRKEKEEKIIIDSFLCQALF